MRLAVLLHCARWGLLAGLVACSASADKADLFPLGAGHRWDYTLSLRYEADDQPATQEPLRVSSTGSDRFQAQTAWVRKSHTGMAYWLRSDASGVYRVASQGPLDPEPLPDEPVRYVLRQPFVVGTTWDARTVPYVLRRRNEFPSELRHLKSYQSIPMHYRIAALAQAVQVPAGRFQNCLRVDGVAELRLYVDEAFAWREVPIYSREWFCPGVGLVKLEREERSPTKFIQGGWQTLVLQRFE